VSFELGLVEVSELRLGARTALHDGVLSVDADGLSRRLLDSDRRLAGARVHVVRPKERTRLVCVKDVIEPRCKVRGEQRGEGRRHALAGMAVVTCGQIVGFQEGLIDMSGPGAGYAPFSALQLLVLELDPVEGLAPHEHEAALREAGIRAADVLGQLAADAEPSRVERCALEPCSDALPRVAYVYMLLSQGLLHDTWVEGRNARDGLPRLVPPAFALDDGIVSGNCVSACDKNTTWHHQNNPILRELFRRHGRDLNFAGVVLTNEPVRLGEKRASAQAAIELTRSLEAAGAIISKEGFGNPDADQMMLIRGLESAGVRTVAITDEYAGVDGASQSLADTAREADAIVSVGNANELLELPAMDRVIGPANVVEKLAGVNRDSMLATGGLRVELQALVGATNQLGQGRLRCVDA